MTRVSIREETKKRSVVSRSQIPVLFDGHEFLLTNVIYGQEAAIFYKDIESSKRIYHIWGELRNASTDEVSRIHIQYRRDGIGGFVIQQANFRGNVGSQYNYQFIWNIISGWEYYSWAKTYYNYPDYY